MLVAISLLIASVTFLCYRHLPRVWLQHTDRTLRTPRSSPSDAHGHKLQPDENTQLRPAQDEASTGIAASIAVDEEASPHSTPKAVARDLISISENVLELPSFSLQSHNSDEEDDNLPPPSFPAPNSAQRASMSDLTTPSSMRPQSLLALTMGPPLSSASTLRQAAGMASLRVPASSSGLQVQASRSNSLAPQGAVPSQVLNLRGKVTLTPGHSPLDWANLQRSGKNMSGVTSFMRVTPSMLKQHNGRKGRPAWSSWQGKVYNITPYLPYHPGGEGELRRAAGKNGEKLFMEVHPWVNWENMLGECLVGIMVGEHENRSVTAMESKLDEMD
ncbi:hypothetical protein M501DRAFT_944433 [Patellaria atrata CBS 101060]|uniref:Cytochrome b5 heme-binding domain-containing protein n=1 Tax=Patellaria atrata CBS 101060 TaxID=1346257 RepID=A0A9P4S0W2_9PEZI|nr:hypothetical protein M501DRAFT_944433 [Patellaria atrata CBS 101060]